MKDFTLHTYRKLLTAIQDAGYHFFTFEDWCKGNARGRYVILRHDVDLKAGNSLITAQLEASMGIRATYYFRIVPQSNQPGIIQSIAGLGHEIGYHYEDLSLFHGDTEKAIEHFNRQLNHFRQFYPVKTICMHGSPTSKWDNRDLWKIYNYRDFGIIGEPYIDLLIKPMLDNIVYLTDTARMWDGEKFNVRDKVGYQLSVTGKNTGLHSTFDLINWLKVNDNLSNIMITTHPQRWTDNKIDWMFELTLQTLKNLGASLK